MMERRGPLQPTAVTLVDILDKVLDKGLVVVGDIRVSLANVELLTIQIRLLLCSIDKAAEIGLDWWRQDRFLGGSSQQESEAVIALRERVAALERALESPPPAAGRPPRTPRRPRTGREG